MWSVWPSPTLTKFLRKTTLAKRCGRYVYIISYRACVHCWNWTQVRRQILRKFALRVQTKADGCLAFSSLGHTALYMLMSVAPSKRPFRVYLGVRTRQIFLCFPLFVIVLSSILLTSFFLCFTSLVSITGSYTEDEPTFHYLKRIFVRRLHSYWWRDSQ